MHVIIEFVGECRSRILDQESASLDALLGIFESVFRVL